MPTLQPLAFLHARPSAFSLQPLAFLFVPAYELIRFASPEPLAQSAAENWLAKLETARPQPARYCVALSGGRMDHRRPDISSTE